MDVTIVGAGGEIGRQIVKTLVQERILPTSSRLQLAGHHGGRSATYLPGLASDLTDAYAEVMPILEVCLDAEAIRGDIIIFAAGATVSGEAGQLPDRRALGVKNRPLFEKYAQTLARNRPHGEEIVIIVSNPVELGVEIFARHFDRSRVIGMGAFSDTLRFRREIAAELGLRRQNVQGLVLGEHGAGLVACWSTVHAFGHTSPEQLAALAGLCRHENFQPIDALRKASAIFTGEGPDAAYRFVNTLGADLRTFVRPFITFFCSNTPMSTAESVARLVETLVDGKQILAAAQMAVEGEFLDIHGVTGVPVILSNHGAQIEAVSLLPHEAQAVQEAAARYAAYSQSL